MMGLGVFLLLLGPSAGLYNIAVSLLALVACWVIAITLRGVLCFGTTRDYCRDRYAWGKAPPRMADNPTGQ